MIDFHSHVLQGVDDGSRSLKESLRMLELSARQGVTLMAATPHFYADRDTPEHFLRRRSEAFSQLRQVKGQAYPRLLAGAEVCYFPGLQRTKEIFQLRLEETPYLLLEMPFVPWTGRMADEVLELNQSREIQVVLAHIDRYLSMQNFEMIETFVENGVQLQANADSFLNWHKRRRMVHMMKQGWISFLGSDCHNLTSRPPRIGQALEVIEKKLGPRAVKTLKDDHRLAVLGERDGP